RFQTPGGDFGNYRVKSGTLDHLRGSFKVADAMAASSCFPLGFEPMIMPDDFFDIHEDPSYKELKSQDHMRTGIGLMDGGIVDNQGIGSIMNADNRRKHDGHQFDLIMVCDVASYKMEPWEMSFESLNKGKGSFTSLWTRLTTRKRALIATLLF